MTTFNSSLFAKMESDKGYTRTNESSILNPYVEFNKHDNTQTLADSLVAESIQMRGIECYYIEREYTKLDTLFGEDPLNKFEKAWKFAAYLDSFDNYSGNNSFYSKFGMTVNDQITITVNPNLFKYQVNNKEPIEGDLIYFPMDNSLFEITWVQPYDPFYQVGQNSIRKITADKFVYSGEKITPNLQTKPEIQLDEFSELELEPIGKLNGSRTPYKDSFPEVENINSEAAEFVKPYVVVNADDSSPFTDI